MNFAHLHRMPGGSASRSARRLWAVSLPANGPAQRAARVGRDTDDARADARRRYLDRRQRLAGARSWRRTCRPTTISMVDAPADGGGGAGKPVDDIAFVKTGHRKRPQGSPVGARCVAAVEEARIEAIAEMLVTDHSGANAKLAKIAETKGWPVPARRRPPRRPPAPPVADFDAKWTAEMIAGHERSVALYRAQATGGEDKDLAQVCARHAADHRTPPGATQELAEMSATDNGEQHADHEDHQTTGHRRHRDPGGLVRGGARAASR